MVPLAIFVSALAIGPVADPVGSKGRLAIVGGGSAPKDLLAKSLELSGGAKANILIVPQASALADTGEKSASQWRDLGARTVTILDLGDPKAARTAIRDADLIWIPGGDQNRLLKALSDARLSEAIHDRNVAGAIVGGTSAGAAALSKVMLTGEGDVSALKTEAVKTAEGLGLWPEVIVDQHFLRRARFNRLMAAVIDRPRLLGIGIDEATGILVTGSEFEVYGASQVLVIDARASTTSKPGKHPLPSATGVALHVLTAGMRFQWGAAETPSKRNAKP